MKKLLLLITTIFVCAGAFGQDPELEGEWKLAHMFIDGVTYPSPLVDPTIYVDPTLTYTINPDEYIDTNIQGDDDILGSIVSVNPLTNEITVDNGWVVLLGLGFPRYPDYRNQYFDLLTGFIAGSPPLYTLSYEIINETGGVRTLVITDDIGNYAKYSSAPIPFHLFDDWELEKLNISGTEHLLPVNGEEFTPFLFFAETYDPAVATFTGDSGCNDFDGLITYDVGNEQFTIDSNNIGGNSCTEPQNNNFEMLFTDFLFGGLPATFDHSTTIDEGLVLELTKSNGDKAFFRRDYYLLSAPVIESSQFSIYPNPASEILTISSEGIVVESLSVYSITGQRIIYTNDPTNQIDVSSLSEGLYLLEITSENGRQVQKFIKK
ncbi:MAG: T9SS C-terminal target domain-containing protein [Flavobacterium sp.]|nr:MAG: T9SS C-terminal target domain-containing protein [Flavobacterium sp.]